MWLKVGQSPHLVYAVDFWDRALCMCSAQDTSLTIALCWAFVTAARMCGNFPVDSLSAHLSGLDFIFTLRRRSLPHQSGSEACACSHGTLSQPSSLTTFAVILSLLSAFLLDLNSSTAWVLSALFTAMSPLPSTK